MARHLSRNWKYHDVTHNSQRTAMIEEDFPQVIRRVSRWQAWICSHMIDFKCDSLHGNRVAIVKSTEPVDTDEKGNSCMT